MANIILFDPEGVRERLLPLTFTRPVALLRHGIMTIAEKWQQALPGTYSFHTQDYLREKFPEHATGKDIYIPGNVEPDPALVEELSKRGCVSIADWDNDPRLKPQHAINHVWELFSTNDAALKRDFEILTRGRKSGPLCQTNRVVGDSSLIFLEPGATVECANLNTTSGPIYIGKDAEVMEGASLRGPVALCEGSVVKMGGKIYGATTLGPHCKVGGELSNVVMTGYSNKAHDGFLGNAVTGEWCNLGAGCTASNLKNTYGKVRVWSYVSHTFERTDLQFCGLIMGDHSKAGINTMFNTATTLGVGVNFYGAGFPRAYIPSFMQGTPQAMSPALMEREFETAEAMMARRGVRFTDVDRRILEHIQQIDR